ncbi:hypothetical protein Zmor_002407 [Zophobas morio]|uniref:Uncharacterized protein n=1 Tax=Zophobas morio TaxID=2755281 RepID=A0AA38MTR7_9CUCU|nr:hypothetical protein Zmor_002407 [Zophobas morio]
MTNTRNSKKENNSNDQLVKLSDLRQVVSDVVRRETAKFLKKIEDLEDQINHLTEINNRLFDYVSGNGMKDRDNQNIQVQALDTSTDSEEFFDTEVPKNSDKDNRSKEKMKKTNPPTNSDKDTGRTKIQPIRPKQNVIKGTGGNDNGNDSGKQSLKAPDRRIWLYVGGCDPKTKEEDVEKHLTENWPHNQFAVTKLDSKGTNASFKVSTQFDNELLTQLYDPGKWPERIIVKQYRFFRKAGTFRE